MQVVSITMQETKVHFEAPPSHRVVDEMETILDAQEYTKVLVEFLIKKTRFFDRLRDELNPRQEKALPRMFRAGPEGFVGGLSAGNYVAITHASAATATRDLQDLVGKQALLRTGALKNTRYHLNIRMQHE